MRPAIARGEPRSGFGLPTQRPWRRFTPSWRSNVPRITLLAMRPCPVEFTERAPNKRSKLGEVTWRGRDQRET